MITRLLSSSVLVFFVLLSAWAAEPLQTSGQSEYTVSKQILTVEKGLASHEVFCGVQDQQGFLWFGTRNGLNRYDGQKMLLISRQSSGLRENKIVQMATDGGHRLFIEYGSTGFNLATNGKIDVMDLSTGKAQSLASTFKNMPFREQDVYWIANNGSNAVCFLTAHPFRLWKFTSKRGFVLQKEMKEWDQQSNSRDIDFRSTGPLNMFAANRILLKLHNQLVQYHISPNEQHIFQQKDALRSLPLGYNKAGELLITYNTTRDPDHFVVGALGPRSQFRAHIENSDDQTQNITGKYWYQAVSSLNGDASVLYIKSDALYFWNAHSFIRIVDQSEIKSFESLVLYQLFSDKQGNLWLCTSAGIIQLKIRKNRFSHYFSSAQQTIEKNNQARGILANTAGIFANIWRYTFYDLKGKYSYAGDESIKYALSEHHGDIFCGGFELFRYSRQKNSLTPIPGGLGTEIWSMHSWNDSLLILGRSDGLSIYNSSAGKFDSLNNKAKAKFVYRIFRKRNGQVWVVAENGLFQIDREKSYGFRETEVPFNPSLKKILSRLSLMDAFEDREGILWIATNGDGLYRFDQKTNETIQFNIASGFPSDVLYRIEADQSGKLWISTDLGLVKFDPKTFQINTFTVEDGLSTNEFNRTSSFHGTDGRLYFGGLDGIIGFQPKEFKPDSLDQYLPLRVLSFHQFDGGKNELMDRTQELNEQHRIVLNPSDKFFILEFQLLDFAKDRANRYAYYIEGLDKNWNFISENSLRMSGVPYGDYTLRVKAQNSEGTWSPMQLAIPLHVPRPFFLKWWFLIAVGLLLGAFVYCLIRWRIYRLAKEKNILEVTVKERTAQLRKVLDEQSVLLAEKDVLMKEIHHRVKNNLQVISGLLELQGKVLDDETARDALREGRNRVRSIALIHQNLYQFENLSTIALRQFVQDLCRQIESVFRKDQKVVFSIEVDEVLLDIDTAVPLGLILNELLTNSYKYAFENSTAGEIHLNITENEPGRFTLQYWDNGPGLPDHFDIRKVTTLGLQLVADLTRQIGGSVRYSSHHSEGFKIQFTNRNIRKSQD